MSTIINTNSLSLLTQNNLIKSQSSLTTAIQRLSSGLRINSAKDDAAGQAIANRFTASITGLTQSQRNANDGISLAQTTEGALNEINTNLQRVRELTVQASNGSNSVADKTSIQAEITQRLAEIDRTSAQTDFNGTKVLSSTAKSLNVQVGANDGETIAINLSEISSKTLGLTGFNVNGSGTPNTAAATSDLLVAGFATNGAPVNGTQQYDKTTTNALATSANVFSKLATGDSVTYTGTNTGLGLAATTNKYTYDKTSNSFSFDVAAATDASVATFLTPTTGGSTAATVTIGANAAQNVLIDSAGKITAADNGAAMYLDTVGNLSKTNATGSSLATLTNLSTSMSSSTVTAGTGGTITIGTTVMTANAAVSTGNFAVVGAKIGAAALQSLGNVGGYSATIATVGAVIGGTYSVAAGTAATGGVVGGAGTSVDANGALTASTTTVTSYYAHSNGAVMDNAGNAVYADSANAGKFTLNATSGATSTANPLAALDAALQKVDTLRGSLGAVQNRFDSVISNLGSTITNLAASRSRIQDADYATEVSNMTRAQILQQAGTSVLAKANQSTQGVMALLQ